MAGRPVLIVAHPGHELNVFCWMEHNQPRVSILTNGSGNAAASRVPFSEQCVRAAGASPGAVFGSVSDRCWYAALLAGTYHLLEATVNRILADISDEPPAVIVSDSADGYNPMHDLCAAMAETLCTVLSRAGSSVIHACYPLPSGVQPPGEAMATIRLREDERTRKLAALAAYLPLQREIDAVLQARPNALDDEALVHAGGPGAWPDRPAIVPLYEAVGCDRVAQGRYRQAISYRKHLLPAVRHLQHLGRCWGNS